MAAARKAAPKASRRAGEATSVGYKPPKGYKPTTTGPASTESSTWRAAFDGLEKQMRARFSGIEPVFAWGIHGWRVPRMKKVEWTTGIMDPNWLFVGLAERKAGITLHMWNPVDYGCLQRHAASLKDAGFKVMVGCIQFNRKSEYPMSAVKSLLDDVAKGWNADG